MALLAATLSLQHAKAQKETFQELIKKELTYKTGSLDRMFEVQNLNGSITVEGYTDDVILVEVEKTISADNKANLELGQREIGINIIQEGSTIVVYPQVPNMEYRDGEFTNIDRKRWIALDYEHTLNFKIKLPSNIKLEVGAVNQGEVLIKNTEGNYIEVRNINGGIVLENITGQTQVHCINGEVKISYAKNPNEPSTYYSLNGDITITYQKNLSANIAFKSMNGELFTDFDIAKQFARTTKDEPGKKSTKYRYESKPVVQIGNGGIEFDFETLNGDVIIKKI